MTDIKEIKDGELEKISGGSGNIFPENFIPDVDDGQPFLYDGHEYCWMLNDGNLMQLEYSKWAVRLDENGNPTGIIVQIPNEADITYIKSRTNYTLKRMFQYMLQLVCKNNYYSWVWNFLILCRKI